MQEHATQLIHHVKLVTQVIFLLADFNFNTHEIKK